VIVCAKMESNYSVPSADQSDEYGFNGQKTPPSGPNATPVSHVGLTTSTHLFRGNLLGGRLWGSLWGSLGSNLRSNLLGSLLSNGEGHGRVGEGSGRAEEESGDGKLHGGRGGYFDENGESRKLRQRNGMLLLAHDAASRSPYEHAGIDIGLLADLSFSTSTNRVDLPKI
jgi:hypothetical protein